MTNYEFKLPNTEKIIEECLAKGWIVYLLDGYKDENGEDMFRVNNVPMSEATINFFYESGHLDSTLWM